jgi:hypothetical protein
MPLHPSVLSQVSDIIEDEVKRSVNEKLTEYIYYISKQYDISQKLLFQDLEKIENGTLDSPKSTDSENRDGQCRGVNASGKRCIFSGKCQGYCKKHTNQKKIQRPTIAQNTNQIIPHTHSFSECLYKIGCPACEKFKKSPSTEKLLIEL